MFDLQLVNIYMYAKMASFLSNGALALVISTYRGGPVDYGGRVRFGGRNRRGVLVSSGNGSGHYQPPAALAEQAGLPMELFSPSF
jgi:hypothetical protein